MSKNTLSTSDYQTYPTLFELEPVGGKKVMVDCAPPRFQTSCLHDSAVASYRTNGGEDVRMFHSFMYKAKSWKHQQRVVVKIEVSNLGTNVRYVVTDFKGQRSSFIYSECYCDRGRMELMISELKNGLKADRMSCNKFSANQFRLYLHCAAYVLMHAFQEDMLTGTGAGELHNCNDEGQAHSECRVN